MFIVARHSAGVPKRIQVLRGIEAEARQFTERSCAPPAPRGAEGLRRIFHHHHARLSGDVTQCVHVGALAIEMYGKNRLHANMVLD